MDEERRRLAVSLGLKAARWLAGSQHNGHAVPLSTRELSELERLVENGIRKSRLEDFEQMRATARPMELQQISEALGVDLNGLISEAEALIDAREEELAASLEAVDAVGALPLEQAESRTPRDVRR